MKLLLLVCLYSFLQPGIIFISTDHGGSWKNSSKGLPADAKVGLGAIAVADGKLAVAVKNHGIYRYNFAAQEWVSATKDGQVVRANPAALIFFNKGIFVGTQFAGVFYSSDNGVHWRNVSTGLGNLTIRRFVEVAGKLYTGTNAGLYSYREQEEKWILEYGNDHMQVNGIAGRKDQISIATNQGVFMSAGGKWQAVMKGHSVHNISVVGDRIYAMTYNELFSSADNGMSWQSVQKGMPDNFYTFNVMESGGQVLAGQWDGIYRWDDIRQEWGAFGKGLPSKLAVTNMKVSHEMVVVSGSAAVY